MKIDPRLKMRSIAGETIVMLHNTDLRQPPKVMTFNETAKFLWEKLFGMDFEIDDAVRLIMENYENVTVEQAKADVIGWTELLKECGAIL